MLRSRLITMVMLSLATLIAGSVTANAQQQGYDISSGGQPTITGGLDAIVSGTGDPIQNLIVNINFGEVTPANSNRIVKVTVPIAIRSIQPYQVSASAVTSFGTDPRMLQATDIGFGVDYLRPLGTKAQQCTRSSHIFTSLFNNDPALNVTTNATGRAAYPSTLANVGTSTLLLTGPKLTQGTSVSRTTEDGWVFNAIFTVTPQFYAPGNFTLTLTFSIAPGPNVQC